jgi:hypothetical protein
MEMSAMNMGMAVAGSEIASRPEDPAGEHPLKSADPPIPRVSLRCVSVDFNNSQDKMI